MNPLKIKRFTCYGAIEKFINICYNYAISLTQIYEEMKYMAYSDEIKKIHQKCFLSQEAFGREIGVYMLKAHQYINTNKMR